MQIKFKKIKKGIIGITEPAIEADAGYDIYSCEDKKIKSKNSASIKTGFAIELPPGYWFEIMSKSGLAVNNDLIVHNGVIDNGYRGEIIVHIFNLSDKDYLVKKNQKIAQGVIRQQIVIELAEVKNLTKTKRGNKGFGSTGK